MSWQPEYNRITDWYKFNELLEKYANSPYELIYTGKYSNTEFNTPYLRDVRKKVVLVKCSDITIHCNHYHLHFGGSTAFSNETVANTYEGVVKGPWNLRDCPYSEYIEGLKNHILKSGAKVIEDKFYMTWLSYTPAGDSCRETIMRKINDFLETAYNTNPEAKNPLYSTGIIVMDFPTKELIHNIISFKFQGKINYKLAIV